MPCWAKVPLEHCLVTCNGCSMHPLKGPRFKCVTCPDFDLCGECFAKRGCVHGGEHADHQFQCIMTDSNMWKRGPKAMFGQVVDCKGEVMKGNGKGKCKGK